jgi:hypothetical protein
VGRRKAHGNMPLMGFKLSAAERIKLSHVSCVVSKGLTIYVAFGSTRGSFEILIICEILIISGFFKR